MVSANSRVTEFDDAGNLRCKKCLGFVQWGTVELIYDSENPKGRRPNKKDDRKYILLDPDFVPHGCRKDR